MGPRGPQGGGLTPGQASALATLMAARVSSGHGLPPVSRPFAGVPGTRTSAANARVPDLTARVALAKATRQRLTHGGLAASDPTRERSAIDTIVRNAPPLAPPSAPSRSVPHHAPAEAPGALRAPGSPRQQLVDAQPGQGGISLGGLGHLLTQPLRDPAGTIFAPTALALKAAGAPTLTDLALKIAKPVAKGIDYGVGTTAETALAGLTGDTKFLKGSALHAGSYRTTEQAASDIQGSNLHLPDHVPGIDLVPGSYGSGTKGVTPQALVAQGLSAEQTKRFRQMALQKHHWYPGEINNLNGLDLIAHAYSDPAPLPLRIIKNAASDLVRTAELPNVGVAAIQQTAAGHPLAAATGIGSTFGQQIGDLARNPWQAFVSDPYVVAGELGAAGKLAGMLGHAVPGAPLERSLVPKGATSEAPVPVGSGAYSKNWYTQGVIERPHDWLARHNQHVSDALIRKQVDLQVQHASNEVMGTPHTLARNEAMGRVGNIVGKGGVKNSRAELIQQAQRFGGIHPDGTVDLPALQKAQAAWEHAAKRDGPGSPAETQVALLRDKIIPGLVNLERVGSAADLAAREAHVAEAQGVPPPSNAVRGEPDPAQLAAWAAKSTEIMARKPAASKFTVRQEPITREWQAVSEDGSLTGMTHKQKHYAERDAAEMSVAQVDPEKLARWEAEASAHAAARPRGTPAPPPSGIEPRGVTPNSPASRMSEADTRYAQAHAELAAHTSGVRGSPKFGGGFGDTATLFRRWEQVLAHDAPLRSTESGTQAIRTGDPLAREVFAARQAWLERASRQDVARGRPLPEDAAALKTHYDETLRAYIDQKVSEGAAEPVRSKYIQTTVEPGGHASASKFGFASGKRQRTYASSSASADTGNYRHDVASAQHESRQAAVTMRNITAFENVTREIGRYERNPDYVLGPGETFVSTDNAARLGHTLNDIKHPGDEHAHESNLLTAFNELVGTANKSNVQTGTRIKGPGFVFPTAAIKRMEQYTTPLNRTTYQRVLAGYQKALVGTGPGTLLGNTLGTVPFGVLGGAGPLDYWAALRHTINDPSTVPYTMHNAGVAGAFTEEARGPLGKLNPMRAVNTSLRISRTGEDVTRQALFISKMGGWKDMTKRAAELGYKDAGGKTGIEEVKAYARDVAQGKVDVHLRDQAAAHTIQLVGDNLLPSGELGRKFGNVIMFHKWVEHVSTLMLKTLPVHHPLRLTLINVLSQYGQNYRQEHGVWPSWMSGFAPLFPEVIAGNAFTRTMNLNQFSPQGTAGNLIGNLTSDQPLLSRIASASNPFVGIPLNAGIAEIRGLTNKHPPSLPWTLVAGVLRSFPHYAAPFPSTQRPADWVPFLHDNGFIAHKVYDSLVTHGYITLPDSQRPGARPYGQGSDSIVKQIVGALERYGGLGQYDVPNIPNGRDVQIQAAIKRNTPPRDPITGLPG